MKIITITRAPSPRHEEFLDHTYRIHSRSGLHPAEAALIRNLPSMGPIQSALFLGGRTGAAAMVVHDMFPKAELTIHAFDIYHADTIYRNLCTNGIKPNILPTPDFTIQGAFKSHPIAHDPVNILCNARSFYRPVSHIFLLLTEGAQSAELAYAQLNEVTAASLPGTQVLIIGEGINDAFLKQAKQHLAHLTFKKTASLGTIRATVADPAPKAKTYVAHFQASTPGMKPLDLISLPGTFCHRRPDQGGLALAETAIASGVLAPNATIVDLGCGCGMVGILVEQALPGKTITYVDSSSIALQATSQNLATLGQQGSLILSANGAKLKAPIDAVLTNPPYFSDYKIATLFIENAFTLLRRGGTLFFVAKSPATPQQIIETTGFKDITTTTRRGYTIIRATR